MNRRVLTLSVLCLLATLGCTAPKPFQATRSSVTLATLLPSPLASNPGQQDQTNTNSRVTLATLPPSPPASNPGQQDQTNTSSVTDACPVRVIKPGPLCPTACKGMCPANIADLPIIPISSEDDLKAININNKRLGGIYRLTNNITVSSSFTGIQPSGDSGIYSPYEGSLFIFDGAGYSIENVNAQNGAVFGRTTSKTNLYVNLTIKGLTVPAGGNEGAIVSENNGLALCISNVLVEGAVFQADASSSNHVGGLVGSPYNGTNIIDQSTVRATFDSGGASQGGLVGAASSNLTILNSCADVTAGWSGALGGLVGSHVSGTLTIKNSTAKVTFPGNSSTGYLSSTADQANVGGLVGSAGGSVLLSQSGASGNIQNAASGVGGLIGNAAGPVTIDQCRSSVNISNKGLFVTEVVLKWYDWTAGTNIGGLVGLGSGWTSSISNSYATGSLLGTFRGSACGSAVTPLFCGGVAGLMPYGSNTTFSNSFFAGSISSLYATSLKLPTFQHSGIRSLEFT